MGHYARHAQGHGHAYKCNDHGQWALDRKEMEKKKKEKTPRALGKGTAGQVGGENPTYRTPNLEEGRE